MDVNGTRFHLVLGQSDWRRFTEELLPGETRSHVRWDADHDAETLAPLMYFFSPPTAKQPPDVRQRRGAAADVFGAIYSIGEDRRTIWRLRPGRMKRELYWSGDDLTPSDSVGGDEFAPVSPASAPTVSLAGLTVTAHHYLIVGNIPGRELLAFDLYAGGAPVHLEWPAEVPFEPFDFDAAKDGGLWVLDRVHACCWRVDRTFRVVALDPGAVATVPQPTLGDFAPVRPPSPPVSPAQPPLPHEFPRGIPLTIAEPVAIAALPDGTYLVLYLTGGHSPSAIVRYRGTQQLQRFDLASVVPVSETELLSVAAYDLAYTGDERTGALWIVERGGEQAFRFRVDWKNGTIAIDDAYLPMQSYGGASLVVRGDRVLYEVGDRWIELRPVNRPRYADDATLLSLPFDGAELDCAWHRILLDACIPPGVSIDVAVRASNDRRELASAEWITQPRLYRRGVGAEIPYYVPFAEDSEHAGVWETLIQQVRGRWMQIRLRIVSTGRVTPQLHALRLHYPRFSYLERYLPHVYRDDASSASFVERLLADFEGLYTTWEGRIEQVERFFDPRAVPDEAIDWLTGWLGEVAEPLWDSPRKRLFLEFLMELYRWRGTEHGVLMALRLYVEPSPDRSIFDPPLPPSALLRGSTDRGAMPRPRELVRVVERFRMRRTGAAAQGVDTGAPSTDALAPLTLSLVEGAAHRFDVLVPDGLDLQRLDAVRRIVDLQKPAHTCYALHTLWALFRVGVARLEMDTDLGDGRCFEPMVLGAGYLGAGSSLGASYPFNVGVREVLDRDRFGFAPPL